MTVSSDTNRSGPYTGNGVTTSFSFGFRIVDPAHVQVIRTEAGVETVLTLTTDYTVTGVGDAEGGSIDAVVAPTSLQTITLLRDVPFVQETDLENQGAYFAETVERVFDLGVMRDQQLGERLDRAVVIPASADPAALDDLIEDIILLADMSASIDTVAADIASVNTVASNIAAVNTVAGIDAAVSTVAGISGNVSAVAGDSAEINALAAITADIQTVSGVSADVATVAGISANVTTVAGVAVDIPTVASVSTHIANAEANADRAEAAAVDAEAAAAAFPLGGSTGQVLAKASAADRDTGWIDPPSTGIALATSLVGLAALDVATNGTAFLSLAHRSGFWRLRTVASLSAAELAARAADSLGGIFINSTDDVAYVWHRIYSGALNVHWFDVPGDLSITTVETYDRLDVCWYVAIELAQDIYHPAGIYDCGDNNFPYRQKTAPVALMDCKNIKIFGDGPTTHLQTTSAEGADVIQLWGVQNLIFDDMNVRSYFVNDGRADTLRTAGSNAFSVVAGWDNLEFGGSGLTMGPCAYIDRGTYVDGGKALSFQSEAATLTCGRARARYTAKFCSQGFGFESSITNMATKAVSIDVEVMAERCYMGVVHGAPAASGAVVENLHSGIRVKSHLIDCQIGVFLGRTHGIDVDATFSSIQAASTKATSHTGSYWNSSDLVTVGVKLGYAKDSNIRASGNVGPCDYMAMIGSASAGSSTLTTATNNCNIDMRNLRATPAVSIITDLTTDGTALTTSELVISGSAWSSGAVPASFLVPTGTLKNNCYVGTTLLT